MTKNASRYAAHFAPVLVEPERLDIARQEHGGGGLFVRDEDAADMEREIERLYDEYEPYRKCKHEFAPRHGLRGLYCLKCEVSEKYARSFSTEPGADGS